MQALTGYFTIGVLILIGYLLAAARVLTSDHQQLMSRLALTVASPVLMLMMISRADLSRVFARSVIASYTAIAVAAATYLVLALLLFRPSPGGRTIGTLLSSYTNAGNLGLPIATYALGDATWIAPILMVQMIVMQPLALAHLDAVAARDRGGAIPVLHLLTIPLRNPLTVGALAGLVLNLTNIRIPTLLATPLDMLGGTAVPLMLLAFGISLRLDPKPSLRSNVGESISVVTIKCLLQPAVAFVVATFVLQMPGDIVRAVTVLAALPPAQNIFVIASRYRQRELFARDTTFVATMTSAVVILALLALIGR